MRTALLCFLLLACCLTGAAAKDRVVERPAFAAATTRTIEIERVALSDTATVLDIHAYNKPGYWIRINGSISLSTADGQRYALRRAEGIEPGKEFFMPESGEATFRFVFPPLPATVREFDLCEGEMEGAYRIYGVNLTKKLPPLDLPVQLKRQKPDCDAPLPPLVFEDKPAMLTGKLLGYRDGLRLNFTAYSWDLLDMRRTEAPFAIEADGSFRCEMPLTHPTVVDIFSNRSWLRLRVLLVPGRETRMYLNLRELFRQVSPLRCGEAGERLAWFEGEAAAANEQFVEMLGVNPYNREMMAWHIRAGYLRQFYKMTPEDYAAFCRTAYEREQARIDAARHLCPAARQLLSVENLMQHAGLFIKYQDRLTEALMAVEGKSYDEAEVTTRQLLGVDADFYAFYRERNVLNHPDGLYTDQYAILLDQAQVVHHLQLPEEIENFGTWMLRHGELTEDDRAFFSRVEAYIRTGSDSVLAEADSARIESLNAELGEEILDEYDAAEREYVLRTLMGRMPAPDDPSALIGRAKPFGRQVREFSGLDSTWLSRLPEIGNPAIEAILRSRNDVLQQSLEEERRKNQTYVGDVSQAKDDEMFAAIVAKHRGKVVLVDLWTTWCSPCREGIRRMKPVKEELADKDIAYVYLTNESSNRKQWEEMITTIGGDHYWLTKEQWVALQRQFLFSSIPTYIVVAPDGSIAAKQEGFRGPEHMKKMLLDALPQ